MQPIRYLDRDSGQIMTEQVYGEGFLRWIYGHPLGALALSLLVKRRIFSAWYGWRMNQASTIAKIQPFIERYGLDPSEFRDAISSYRNFNEFFYRKLSAESRPVDSATDAVVFPADGRHLGFADAAKIDSVFVKGQRFDLGKLLGDDALAARLERGSLVLSRLCPVDYHRFHFPVSGVAHEPHRIGGPLYSVSPLALRQRLAYLWENKRVITRIDSDHCGSVWLIEIGATCVGSIRQTFTPEESVAKGEEKGYFEFGGSSVITLFEPNAVVLDQDLLQCSADQTELYARFGTRMGRFA